MQIIFAALGLLFVLLVGPALAQGTTVDGASIFGPFRPYIVELVGILVAAFSGWVLNEVRKRTGLDIEARHREALQTALTNAAGLVISRMDGAAGALKIDVKHPAIAEGIEYVVKAAPDALAYWGITPESLREKVYAKVGVVSSSTNAGN